MYEREMQEWEEYDGRPGNDPGRQGHATPRAVPLSEANPSPFILGSGDKASSEMAEETSESYEQFSQEAPWQGDSVFETEMYLSGTPDGGSVQENFMSGAEEMEDAPRKCKCGCGEKAADHLNAENEYESAFESTFESSYESSGPEFSSETISASDPRCQVDCQFPPEADLKKIKKRGDPKGQFIERTQGDPKINFALQLFDYDVNAYNPSKDRHAEALGRIREFVEQRLVQSNQPVAITLTGAASLTGTLTYNDILSCKRARCAADNLTRSLAGTNNVLSRRIKIIAGGEGFARSTCKGSDCELGEWRSVLVQVHAPSNPPLPIPVVDPGWDKYKIRCCSFHTSPLLTGLLGDLLKKEFPELPEGLRSKVLTLILKGLKKLSEQLIKQLPKLEGLAKGVGELLKLFPAEFIRETAVFELRERDKQNPRAVVLCYTGYGLRLPLPRKNLDEFLDEIIGKVPVLKALPDFVKNQIKDAIKKVLPDPLKTLIQPIDSSTPGPFARFDLLHPRHMRVFSGRVQLGKGLLSPGRVNVEFDSPPWHIPDPIERPHITTCPDTACNDAGIETQVGDGHGLDLFSISAGSLISGDCTCAAPAQALQRSIRRRSLVRRPTMRREEESFESEEAVRNDSESEGPFSEFEDESESQGEWYGESSGEALEGGSFGEFSAYSNENEDGAWNQESGETDHEADPYATLRPAMSSEHAAMSVQELGHAVGGVPAALALQGMLGSAELRHVANSILLGTSARRSVIWNGQHISVPQYLRMLSRLCHEVAEQKGNGVGLMAEEQGGTAPRARMALKFESVPGRWIGIDYKKSGVAMTSVSLGSGPPLALIFMTHMNIDYDGMGNAYGPANKCPLDSLFNAGWKDADKGYYGVKAYHPKKAPPGVVLATPHEYYQDSFGRVPVVQTSGPYKDFFVSVTSKGVDAGVVPFGALHGGLASHRVAAGNFGMILRPDKARIATYNYLGGEGGAVMKDGKYLKDYRLGECSYKVFLDIGGAPKRCSDRQADNDFPSIYIVFPQSDTSALPQLALGDDYDDLPAFLALQMSADAKMRGASGLPAFNKYVASGRQNRPAGFASISSMLQSRGYLTSGYMAP